MGGIMVDFNDSMCKLCHDVCMGIQQDLEKKSKSNFSRRTLF